MYRLDDAERERIAATRRARRRGRHPDRPGDRGLEPAELSWGTGRADFAVNRRTNKEADVPALRATIGCKGPSTTTSRSSRSSTRRGGSRRSSAAMPATAPSSSCYQFSGDYAGFAQIAIEAAPRASRRCSSRAAAPTRTRSRAGRSSSPRRTARALAEAVDRVLAGAAAPDRRARSRSAYEEIPLKFGGAADPRRRSRRTRSRSDFAVASRARTLLADDRRQGGARPDLSVPGPVVEARRPDLDLPRRRGRRRLLVPDQAQSRVVADLGLGLLQRRDGVHPLGPRPQGRRLRRGRRDALLRPAHVLVRRRRVPGHRGA